MPRSPPSNEQVRDMAIVDSPSEISSPFFRGPLLMISYEAPPRLSAESILMSKTLAGIEAVLQNKNSATPAGRGLIADLICAAPDGSLARDDGLEELLPTGVLAHRLPGNGLPITDENASATAEDEQAVRTWGRFLRRLRRTALGGKSEWIRAAVQRAAEPLAAKQPRLIYSRSHPPASHLAAMRLVHRTRLPWVAHFSDPWSGHVYYRNPAVRAALRHWEKKIFKTAARLVFVSEALRNAMLARENENIRAKAVVIPHHFTESLYPSPQQQAATRNGLAGKKPARGLVVAHIGDFYGPRSPRPVVEAWEKLHAEQPDVARSLIFWQAGRVTAAHRAAFEPLEKAGALRQMPPVSYRESLALATAAEVLLVVEAPADDKRAGLFFPSKMIDYLGAGKPLLALTNPGSVVARLAEEWKQPWCDPRDIAGIAAQLAAAVNNPWPPPAPEVRRRFTSRAAAEKLLRVWTDLVAEKKHPVPESRRPDMAS